MSYSSSTNKLVSSPEEAAQNMITFLRKFFELYPHYLALRFYIYGESYAGHFIPLYAFNVLTYLPYINLVGVGIGNGYVDYYPQDLAIPTYGLKYGLLNEQGYKIVTDEENICMELISLGKLDLAFFECKLGLATTSLDGFFVNGSYPVNYYDVTKPCLVPGCYNTSLVTDFLNLPMTRNMMGVPSDAPPFKMETKDYLIVYRKDVYVPYQNYIVNLLNANVTVLSYNGVFDLICNYIGQSYIYNNLGWEYNIPFQNLELEQLYINNQLIGEYKTLNGLTLINFYNAGHLVPMDQPYNALLMFNEYIKH
jgi:carboxypeptidase C (cathepsin A)